MDSKVQSSLRRYLQEEKKKRKKICEFIVDETLIKVGSSEFVWLWVAIIESKNRHILALSISKERKKHMFVSERFLS